MKIVLASSNAGKLKEIQQILSPLHFECISQASLQIEDIPETGLSFVENALLKARHAAKAAQLPAIADDSGLCVDALEGQPGIYSARFAGENATSEENIQKLLELMKPFQGEARRARFFATLVLIQHATDPIPLICQAAWEGILLTEPRGTGGFGYDPIFYIPELKQTAAELPSDLKNRISHRAKALSKLIKELNIKV